jgi:hypothetical protein
VGSLAFALLFDGAVVCSIRCPLRGVAGRRDRRIEIILPGEGARDHGEAAVDSANQDQLKAAASETQRLADADTAAFITAGRRLIAVEPGGGSRSSCGTVASQGVPPTHPAEPRSA